MSNICYMWWCLTLTILTFLYKTMLTSVDHRKLFLTSTVLLHYKLEQGIQFRIHSPSLCKKNHLPFNWSFLVKAGTLIILLIGISQASYLESPSAAPTRKWINGCFFFIFLISVIYSLDCPDRIIERAFQNTKEVLTMRIPIIL